MSAKEETKNSDDMDRDDSETSSSDNSDDDDLQPEAYTGNEEVLIDFEGRAPVDPDRYGISQLLQRVYLQAHINCMQMANLIIAQNFVGSVIYQCESDGPESDSENVDDILDEGTIFGITTVVNITAKKEETCVSELRNYILDRASKHASDTTNAFFRDLLNNDACEVGYLINERFINIPAQISVPMLESLIKEIEQAKAKKMKFDFHYILMIIKIYRLETDEPPVETYTNDEERVIAEQAMHSFAFSVANECDTAMSGDWDEPNLRLMPYRKVLIFEASKLPELPDSIKKILICK